MNGGTSVNKSQWGQMGTAKTNYGCPQAWMRDGENEWGLPKWMAGQTQMTAGAQMGAAQMEGGTSVNEGTEQQHHYHHSRDGGGGGGSRSNGNGGNVSGSSSSSSSNCSAAVASILFLVVFTCILCILVQFSKIMTPINISMKRNCRYLKCSKITINNHSLMSTCGEYSHHPKHAPRSM